MHCRLTWLYDTCHSGALCAAPHVLACCCRPSSPPPTWMASTAGSRALLSGLHMPAGGGSPVCCRPVKRGLSPLLQARL